MTKETINEDWTNWVIRQIKRGVPRNNIRKILERENYSKKIIDNFLNIKNNYNSYKFLLDDGISILDNIPVDKIKDVTVLNTNPIIITIDNFLSDDICNHFMGISKNNFKRALVSGKKDGFVSKGRTGLNYWIEHNRDSITMELANKIAKIIDMPLENAESYQVIYYGKTQEYRRHYDGWLFDNSDKTERMLKKGGQRILTVLCYLNDVKEGGGTEFPRLNLNIEAKKGRIVIFQNVEDGSNVRHKLSEHAGMPVLDGEKFAFNLWFREKKFC